MANYVRYDKQNRPYKLVGLKKNKNGFPVGYVEMNGNLYKIDVSTSKKEGVELWIKFTKLPKRNNNYGFSNNSF